jgi:predicted nucleic acid-binding protein
VKIVSSPVYLDTSALAKLYVAEAGSDELEAALIGRRDLIVSELAVTELVSAIARRRRDGELSAPQLDRLYRRIAADVSGGEFLRADLTPSIHREAERLLLRIGSRQPLRAADALHLATAGALGVRTLVTFDVRMTAAARSFGGLDVVGVS